MGTFLLAEGRLDNSGFRIDQDCLGTTAEPFEDEPLGGTLITRRAQEEAKEGTVRGTVDADDPLSDERSVERVGRLLSWFRASDVEAGACR